MGRRQRLFGASTLRFRGEVAGEGARAHTRLPIGVVAGLCVLALALGLAPAASANSPWANLTLDPAFGPPGTEVTVTGTGFLDRPVEIRWDTGRDRPLLASTTAVDSRFAVQIKIPDAAPGRHYGVFAIAAIDGPHIPEVGSAMAPFEVTAPPAGDRPDAPSNGPAEGSTPSTGPAGGSIQPTADRVAKAHARARAVARCRKRYRGAALRARKRRAACLSRAMRRWA